MLTVRIYNALNTGDDKSTICAGSVTGIEMVTENTVHRHYNHLHTCLCKTHVITL